VQAIRKPLDPAQKSIELSYCGSAFDWFVVTIDYRKLDYMKEV
tara:strand:+ start:437 stop:565 length:129 start_codon:yes stop_codon:yes gene_type:complete